MALTEQRTTINFNWHRLDKRPIKVIDIEAVEKEILDHISSMVAQGFSSGSLYAKGTEYEGHWEMKDTVDV